MSFLEWIVVGLIAGWLAGQVMKGSFSRSWASLLSVFCFLARLVLISAGSPIHTSKPSPGSAVGGINTSVFNAGMAESSLHSGHF